MHEKPAPAHPRVLSPRPPAQPLPRGACDTHAHVFGPYDRFPLAAGHTYAPPKTTLGDYEHMLAAVGFERGVLVHASAYALDCSLLLHALQSAGPRLRGIAVANSAIADAELAHMRQLGVCGLRFSEFDAPAQQARFKNSVGFSELERLGPRLRALGLHAQLWADASAFARAAPRLLGLQIPLVLDHMGYFDVNAGTGAPAFQTVLALLREERIWVKSSPNRVTRSLPGCEDVRPFHDALLAANPRRLVWGSDWPYLSMGDNTPDVGDLLDRLATWCGDAALQRQILVANAAELYDFERA